MRSFLCILISALSLFWSCSPKKSKGEFHVAQKRGKIDTSYSPPVTINPDGKTLLQRINTPGTFNRVQVDENSFSYYLRHLPLKPHKAKVKFYDGHVKSIDDVYMAVVDLEIGNKNLHQCADAIIRLRGEYLYEQKQYEKIHFNFTNGFRVDYEKWMKGNRMVVDGNETFWTKSAEPSNNYNNFWKYMELIFTYAGTLSLEKELHPVSIDNLSIGDVFIQGGSPGHAVIVVDVAVRKDTGEKVFLLAQSYMPAQEIQILQNPNGPEISPWYKSDFGDKLITPEWTFRKGDLKRFED